MAAFFAGDCLNYDWLHALIIITRYPCLRTRSIIIIFAAQFFDLHVGDSLG